MELENANCGPVAVKIFKNVLLLIRNPQLNVSYYMQRRTVCVTLKFAFPCNCDKIFKTELSKTRKNCCRRQLLQIATDGLLFLHLQFLSQSHFCP
jgi:hypothetical protein